MKLDTFSFDIDADGIAHAVFDVPGRSMNNFIAFAVAFEQFRTVWRNYGDLRDTLQMVI